MGQELLLVGSIPLKTVEDVMRTFGGTLGRYLPAIPDGEVGERRSWVLRLSYQVFNGHIDLETIKRPARVNGVEQLMPRGRDDVWQFKVKPGVDAVRFGNPGYRLGYAKDATNSYFVFKTLRENGVIPQGVRFQISHADGELGRASDDVPRARGPCAHPPGIRSGNRGGA